MLPIEEKGKVVTKLQDLRYLKWSHARTSSGTAGTFLKSESVLDGKKVYYKLSNFDASNGIVGHECINEIIVDRLLTILGVEHLNYELIHALIEIEGRTYETYLCASKDFKEAKESKTALDNYYRINAIRGESHYDFCERNGWKDYVDTMLAVDYLIRNRDRHGANIEVLRNERKKTVRLAPLFDHGLSLLYSCLNEKEAEKFDVMEDKRCRNFIGGFSCKENLSLISDKKKVFTGELESSDAEFLFKDLDGILPRVYFDKIRDMIYERYRYYESL